MCLCSVVRLLINRLLSGQTCDVREGDRANYFPTLTVIIAAQCPRLCHDERVDGRRRGTGTGFRKQSLGINSRCPSVNALKVSLCFALIAAHRAREY